jgi:signal transduction histidine kinase
MSAMAKTAQTGAWIQRSPGSTSLRMQMRVSRSVQLAACSGAVALLFLGLSLGGCQATRRGNPAAGPAIEFTSVPVAGEADAAVLSIIKGRVSGAQSGQQIVLYARAINDEGQVTWFVQPFVREPFTAIESDLTWRNSTHPGSEYAALLVAPGFQPPGTTRALPSQGVVAVAITKGWPAVWQRWWFPLACMFATAAVIFGAYRVWHYQATRKLNRRFEERFAERMLVAQELHDTLLQGMLSASMQLHVAVDQLPPESPVRPGLNRVLQLMGQVIDEGRTTLRGLRSSVETAQDLGSLFSKIPQEFGDQPGTDFRVIVGGPVLTLQPGVRDEVYRIGREAVINAYRHSHASNIEVELEYAPHQLRVLVRDNGSGIDPQVVRSGRDGHWGLSGMRERAERVGAKLKVWSHSEQGTEVELRVPSEIAFESHRPHPSSNWFKRLYGRRTSAADP